MIAGMHIANKIAITAFTVLCLNACSKGTTETQSITFDVNGSNTICTKSLHCATSIINNKNVLQMQAFNDTANIGISVISPTAFTTSVTYTDTSTAANASIAYVGGFGAIFGSISYPSPNVKLNFSEITSTYVKGTFSGHVMGTINNMPQVLWIQNGRFYIHFQ